MGNFLVCPQRDGSRISVEVCLKKCELKSDCDAFKEVPRETLIDAAKRLKLPAKHLKEIEAVIQVEEKPESESEEKVDSTTLIQPLTEEKNAKEPLPVNEEGVEKGEFDTDVVGDLVGNNKIPYPFNQNTLKPTLIPDGKAGELLSRALSIRTEIEVKFLEMGQVLDEIFENRFYINLGYPNIPGFCEGALEIKWRTANYLRNIYLWQTHLKIPKNEVAKIGWSKAKEIIPVSKDKKEAMRWISRAKEQGMTVEKLNFEVRKARGRIPDDVPQEETFKLIFSVYPGQCENIERALQLAEQITGSEKRGYLLEMMAIEFRSTYEEGSGKNDVVKGLIGRIEVLFGVKIGEIVDVKTGEILR